MKEEKASSVERERAVDREGAGPDSRGLTYAEACKAACIHCAAGITVAGNGSAAHYIAGGNKEPCTAPTRDAFEAAQAARIGELEAQHKGCRDGECQHSKAWLMLQAAGPYPPGCPTLVEAVDRVLRTQREQKALLLRHREAAGWMYQFAAAVGAGVEVLDNLSALSQGEFPPHAWPAGAGVDIAERLRVAEEDTARLDWLVKQGPPGAAEGMGLNDETWEVAVGFVSGEREGSDGRAVRGAIDAGRKGR